MMQSPATFLSKHAWASQGRLKGELRMYKREVCAPSGRPWEFISPGHSVISCAGSSLFPGVAEDDRAEGCWTNG